MSLAIPDVFVSVDIPEPTPTVTSPALTPCVIGEHYHVAQEEFVANVSPGDTGPWPYPGLPSSENDPSQKLSVDTTSRFAPTFTLVAEDGTQQDVTSEMNVTASDFDIGGAFPFSGALYVSYRARHDKYAGTERELLTASSFEELTSLFSEAGIGPANPLGYAMYQSMEYSGLAAAGVAVTNPTDGGQGQYSAQVQNVTGAYSEVLQFLETEDVYTVVPLTPNELVHSLVENHVNRMSNPTGGNQERLTVLAPRIDGEDVVRRGRGFTPWYPITDDTSTDLADSFSNKAAGDTIERGGYTIVKTADGTYYVQGLVPSGSGTAETVTLGGTSYSVSFNGLFLIGLEESAISPPTRALESDDRIEFQADDGSTVEATIQALPIPQHENVIEVDAGGANPVDSRPWQAIRVIDPATERTEFIDLHKAKARSIENERVVLVMPNFVGDMDAGIDVPSHYAAAQLAAEFCRTGEEPAGAAPGVEPFFQLRDSTEQVFRSSGFFTPSELEEIVSAGWTILANDRDGEPVNTLRTVTTDASAVERMEAILVVERDYLSRFFRNELSEGLRDFRISGRTLDLLGLQASEIATTLSDPQSEHYRYQNVSVEDVRQSEENPDTVIYEVTARHLYPYNRGEVEATIVT
ncbi:hypothetical protein [Salinibacter ruber]|uniref:Tail sheath protein subtilisin-like domain-containing protein n=1 Tax=Salinibacter ruber TaxID=146919 RepID=A0AAW5P7S2_9BACT|nr:hypothetical protein [Salinibacter ruber]MCS4157660.1 hypothetical protein [Salinibacter ruber]